MKDKFCYSPYAPNIKMAQCMEKGHVHCFISPFFSFGVLQYNTALGCSGTCDSCTLNKISAMAFPEVHSFVRPVDKASQLCTKINHPIHSTLQ